MAESSSSRDSDLWADPYSYIDNLFEDALFRHNNQVSPALSDMNEVELLEKSMMDSSFSSRIPYLSKSALGRLKPGKLCRYQGIIQDMYGSELYSEAVGTSNTGDGGSNVRVSKYRDVLPNDCFFESQLDSDGDNDNSNEYYRDRQVLKQSVSIET
jgi:Mini-chromosome maintenance replisome factor